MYVVYGRSACIFCDKARALLDGFDLDYNYFDIKAKGEEATLEWIRDQGFKTVPQIFHNGLHVGGYDDLVAYLRERSDGEIR